MARCLAQYRIAYSICFGALLRVADIGRCNEQGIVSCNHPLNSEFLLLGMFHQNVSTADEVENR
eukprot:scaffold69406_cov15-Prasinocladus_malaysianus.AAC.2